MPKIEACNRCMFYAHSPYLVCSVNPHGVDGPTCLDFRLGKSTASDTPVSWYSDEWEPEGASYYDGELILEPVQQVTMEQRLELLDIHPLFTGRCPNCEMPIRQTNPPYTQWNCKSCGWVDDSPWQ